MADTYGHDYSGVDGWAMTGRLERKARPAGRKAKAFAADLELDEEDISEG